MTARDELIEHVARILWAIDYPKSDEDPGDWKAFREDFLKLANGAIPVIVKAVTDRVRELHQPVPNSTSAMFPVPLCRCGLEVCPTVRLLDQIDTEWGQA